MIADCTAVILAGGQSSRMGQDKANLFLGEQTLLQSVFATLQPLFVETIVSVREHRPDISQRQILDDPAHQGPLGGLLAGLEAATTPWIFLAACDMPFITLAVVEHLAMLRQGSDAVVPLVQGHPQPMAAFYAKSGLYPLRNLLQDRTAKHSLRRALTQMNTRYVDEAELRAVDPQLHSFFDLDTPQDLQQAVVIQNTK
ncbi:MAG: molybdenum cofactor guanylyltransferase [Gallionellaceae bacterium]|nr:molybdenum cofactor guanylyltransferase [Gallionellaceae bacterium]